MTAPGGRGSDTVCKGRRGFRRPVGEFLRGDGGFFGYTSFFAFL